MNLTITIMTAMLFGLAAVLLWFGKLERQHRHDQELRENEVYEMTLRDLGDPKKIDFTLPPFVWPNDGLVEVNEGDGIDVGTDH